MMLLGLPAVHLSLSLVGYMKTRRLLERLSSGNLRREATAEDLDAARQLEHLTAIAGQHGLINATCLRQSLLLYWMLRRRGLAPELRLGVRRESGDLDAHAWVEVDGRSLDRSATRHHAFVAH